MRNLGLAKKALLLALCAALAVPAAGMGWTPLTAEAAQTGEGTGSNVDAKTVPEEEDKTPPDPAQELADAKTDAKAQLDDYYTSIEASVPADKKEELKKVVSDAKNVIDTMKTTTGVSDHLSLTKTKMASYIPSNDNTGTETPQEDPQPSTTNSNIMIGGDWVTPVANAGQYVNVVLPVVNMGRSWVDHVVVTPQISQDAAAWPFEIETSNYSQTIEGLPGTDDGGSDMDRRRELTWTLKTRKDAPSGYVPINFTVSYEDENNVLTNVTLTSYVKVVGTTGVSADGKASTPRVIVTGFSTDPETVHAGETFTLTLHMQNTSQATAVKNMVFDIQAASESTDTTYVAAAFLPTAGSSTIFVDQIAPGATKDISMEMEARADLSQKPYVVNVKMNYEDENVNAYENTASVSIPVRQEARIDTSSIEVMPESIEVGSEANVMFSIYNIGKTQLYNTTVKFIGDSITGGETYLGNIAPGATGNVDAYLSGAAATMDDGVIKIEITFEDEAGEATTVEKEMNLFVTEPYYPEMDMDMMADPMADQGGGFKIWYVLVPLALIIAAAAVIVVILKKKKKKAQAAQELADLDEELDDLEDVDISLDEEDTGAESSETEAPDTEASEEETAEGSEEKE